MDRLILSRKKCNWLPLRTEKKSMQIRPYSFASLPFDNFAEYANGKFTQLDFNVIIAKAKHVVNIRAEEFTFF